MLAFRTLLAATRNSNAEYLGPPITAADPYWDSVITLLNGDLVAGNPATNVWTDSSSNNFTTIISGVPGQGTVSPYSTNGWVGAFNGSTTGMSVAANALFNLSAGDWTVEAWILMRGPGLANQSIIQCAETNWRLNITATNTIQYYATSLAITSTATIQPGLWTHIALSRSGSTTTLYINGLANGTTTATPASVTSPVYMGVNYASTGNTWFFNGFLSDVRIVKGTAVYTTNFNPPTAPLPAISGTALLTFQTRKPADASGNGLAIVAAGANASGIVAVQCGNHSGSPELSWTSAAYGLALNGSSDYLSIPADAAFDFGTGDFTIECWVKFNKFANADVVMRYNLSTSSGFAPFMIYCDGALGRISFYASSNGTAWDIASQQIILSGAPVLGAWYHLAVTRQGTTFRTYANGVQGATFTSAAALYSTSTLNVTIGAGRNTAGTYVGQLGGVITNARIVKGQALYTGATTFIPPTGALPVVSGTSLLACNGQTVVDASSNAFTVTTAGSPLIYRLGPANPILNATAGVDYSASTNAGSTHFIGTNADRITVNTNAAFGMGTGDFMMECWFMSSTSNGSNGAMICLRVSGSVETSNVLGVGFGTGNAGKLTWSDGTAWHASTTSLATNIWHHAAVSRQGTTLRLFLNGVLESTFTDATNHGTTRPLRIGGLDIAGGYFSGYISNVRVVKGSPVYTAAFAPPASPVTAISGTSFLMNNSTSLVDVSGHSNFVTFGANIGASSAAMKYGTGSVFFNGSVYFNNADAYTISEYFYLGNDFTVEGWFNPTAVNVDQTICYLNGNSGTYAGCRLGVTAVGKYYLLCSVTGAAWAVNLTSTGAALTVGTWSHFAVSRVGTTVRFFQDGALCGTGTMTGATYGLNYMGIGAYASGPSTYSAKLRGYLDDFRITRGVGRYTAAFNPPTTAYPTHG